MEGGCGIVVASASKVAKDLRTNPCDVVPRGLRQATGARAQPASDPLHTEILSSSRW
jgi:hypothetical protein